MQLSINLDNTQDNSGMDRAKQAQAKKDAKNYEPTWEELWVTGWTQHTGTHKKGIFQTKLTAPDAQKLKEVKESVEQGLIGTHVESYRKFSKSHALSLHQLVKEAKREGILKEMLANKPDNYHLINTEEAFAQLLQMLEHEDLTALDTETTGVKWEDRTVGMSLSLPVADIHVYIPYGHKTTEPQLSRGYVMAGIKGFLERKGLKLVLHNSKFDAHMMEKDGVHIRDNIFFDTMIAMHVLNENEPSFALKKLSNKYGKFFGYEDDSYTFEELFGKDPQAFIEADLMVATIYACKDTHLTLLFYQWQLSMMEKQPKLKSVYFDIEQPNTHVALEMESAGFAIDFAFSTQYEKELSGQVQDLYKELNDRWDINLNSNQQLQKLFYDELGFEDVSGKRSVNADTLRKLAVKHPEVSTLLEYRDTNKLLSTYVEPIPKKVRLDIPDVKGDMRLHGQFNQTGTVTGRWASKEPNLQNLPPRARKMIIAPEGKLMLGIDYSQIEPRTLASMSGDKELQAPYIEGIDLYCTLASKVFGLPYEACLESDDETWRESGLPKHPRKMMKVGLLAVMYGMTAKSLEGSLGISYAEAEQFLQDFYDSYPDMSEWMDQVVSVVDKQGYVETMHGRKRRFMGHKDVANQYHSVKSKIVNLLGREPSGSIWKEELPYKLKRSFFDVNYDYSKVERMSVNAVIQGSASEILKKAMIAVYQHLETKGSEYRLIATIHDELLFEVPETITLEEIKEIEDIMKHTTELAVPIKVDTEVMTTWGEGIPLAEWLDKGQGRKAFTEQEEK